MSTYKENNDFGFSDIPEDMTIRVTKDGRANDYLTVIPKPVLRGVKDPLALAIYCFLQGIPDNFKFKKTIDQTIMDHFKIKEEEYWRAYEVLLNEGLFLRIPIKYENGELVECGISLVSEFEKGTKFAATYGY